MLARGLSLFNSDFTFAESGAVISETGTWIIVHKTSGIDRLVNVICELEMYISQEQ